MKRSKLLSAELAVHKIPDGATISVCGAWMNVPDAALGALEKRFLETGHPRDLTAIFAICPGGVPTQPGIDRLAHEGLLRCVIGGSYPNADSSLRSLISTNKIHSYNLASGMLTAWYHEIGSGGPGVLTQSGLGTFLDPRHTGGRMNEATKDDIVEVTSLNGKEYLFLPSRPIDVAIIRATTSDESGNLTFEHESATTTAFVQAMATRASGGTVIAQVKRVAKTGTLNPHHVKVPGTLVDCIVVDEKQIQASGIADNPALCGEIYAPWPPPAHHSEIEMAMARRAAAEIRPGDTVVVGYGLSALVPEILFAEGRLDNAEFMVEQGSSGGLPLTEYGFGNSFNPKVILDAASQFESFGGGCFDTGILSFLQVDPKCRINVHLLNSRPNLSVGIGGFLDIANNSKRLIILGYFTAGGLKLQMNDGSVQIVHEGKSKKFVNSIDNVSFDPRYCKAQEILFITERAVLRWCDDRLEVIEVSPGIDLEQDVLDQMEFEPQVAAGLRRGTTV